MISDNLQQVNLTPDDVDGAMALSTEAGWNQTADDWRHFISQGTTIGVRDDAGRLVASAAALPYDGPFGYVGMVLVTRDARRRGIATRLVDCCIEELRGRGLVPVLDATAEGALVYRRQGFLDQFGFDRWQGEAGGRGARDHATTADPAVVENLDAGAFGAARPALMRDFLGRSETAATATTAGDGFAMVRAGRRAWQAGPVVAPSETAAISLVERLFSGVSGEVFIDVPQIWSRLGGWLTARGFTIQRSFTRMALGRAEPFGDPASLFAVAGPEFG